MLVGIEPGDIDVDKAHIRVLKGRLRGRGEIGVACADADHQVRIPGGLVGRRCARCADRTQVLGMVVGQGAFPGLGLSDRDAGLCGEL